MLEHSLPLPNAVVLYFFFRNGDPSKSKSSEMLASLIDQLLVAHIDRTTTKNVVDLVKAMYDRERSSSCRSFDKLWETFKTMLDKIREPVFILLDALDECEDGQEFARMVTSSTIVGARFLITSRPEQDLVCLLESVSLGNFISMQMSVADDIHTVVTETIRSNRRLVKFENQIITTILEKAEGMFRYVALMLDELNRPSFRKVPALLDSMPAGLYGFYELILLQLNPDGLFLRKKVLSSIAMAYRPMTVEEMAYALAAEDPDIDGDFTPDDYLLVEEEHIRRACGSLVEITPQKELRFTHLSVKEFLLRNPQTLCNRAEPIRSCLVDPEETHIAMAITCGTGRTLCTLSNITNSCCLVKQLSTIALDWYLSTIIDDEIGLQSVQSPLDYAIVFWLQHASTVATRYATSPALAERLWGTVLHQFFFSANAFELWDQSFPMEEPSAKEHCMFRERYDYDDYSHPLIVSASYGFSYYFSNTIPGADYTVTDKEGRTPLLVAAMKGHEAAVRLLLARSDVDPNAGNSDGSTPLFVAAADGHEEIVRLLLARSGIDPNAADPQGRTSLFAATENDRDAVVRLLLARSDVNPNATDSWYGRTPLFRAVEKGHGAMVRLLLARSDVNPNVANLGGSTPLYIAAENDREAVVRLLLARGDIDLNPVGPRGTPLSVSKALGNERIVQLLSERGAE